MLLKLNNSFISVYQIYLIKKEVAVQNLTIFLHYFISKETLIPITNLSFRREGLLVVCMMRVDHRCERDEKLSLSPFSPLSPIPALVLCYAFSSLSPP